MTRGAPDLDPRRWPALVVCLTAMFLTLLDVSIVNVALPSIGRDLTDEETDLLLESPAGRHVEQMLTYSAVGTREEVRGYLEGFAKQADADELIVAHQSPTTEERLRSVTLTALIRPVGEPSPSASSSAS